MRAPDVFARCLAAGTGASPGAPALDVPSLIVPPIGHSVDVAISRQLGEETVTRT